MLFITSVRLSNLTQLQAKMPLFREVPGLDGASQHPISTHYAHNSQMPYFQGPAHRLPWKELKEQRVEQM